MLVQEYHAARKIVHVDAYRLRDEDEFLALGGDELFAADAVVFIEWAERIEKCLPERVWKSSSTKQAPRHGDSQSKHAERITSQ